MPNTPPSARILSPTPGVSSAPVLVFYSLVDPDSDLVHIEVSFSTDRGVTFRPATEAQSPESEGVINLASSPNGQTHLFYWDATADLPAPITTGVLLRIRPFDSQAGSPSISRPFDVDTTMGRNSPPSVSILSPAAGLVLSPVPIQYQLTDAESDPVRIEVSFSADGGATFNPATEAGNAGSEGTTGLSSDPTGSATHLFAWDAKIDLRAPRVTGVLVRISTFDSVPGGSHTSAPFDVDTLTPAAPNAPPTARLLPFASGTSASPVLIHYQLSDAESDSVHVEVTFSTDGGATFHPATEAVGVGSEGTAGLSSNPTGVDHMFAWNARADLGPAHTAPVVIRIQPSDTQPGISDTSVPLSIDTSIVASPASIPQVHLFEPVPNIGPQVPLRFVVEDDDNQLVDMIAEYSFNSGSYQPAKSAATSDRLQTLPAPFIGADYRFIWDALVDLGLTPSPTRPPGIARLRLTPMKNGVAGTPVETAPFSVDTNPKPAPAAFTPKVPVAVGSLDILSGRDQTGIAGHLLPEKLQLRVNDTRGNPIQGARVSFRVVPSPGSPALVEIEDDLVYRTTTNNIWGFAAVRLRAKPGVASSSAVSGTVEARVVGDPDAAHVQKFRFTLLQPKIAVSPDPAGMKFLYGNRYDFSVGLIGSGSLSNLEYTPDATRPIRLLLTGTNVILSHSQLSVPDQLQPASTHAGAAPVTFSAVLINPRQDATIKISCPSDSTIADKTITLTADPNFGPFRATGQINGFLTYSMAPVYIRSKSGLLPPATTPRVGYPALTLADPFQVEITDDVRFYTEEVTAHWRGCQLVPMTQPLSLQWSASGGTLSTSPGPGTASTLTAGLNTPVYFTPGGPAPWLITVSKDPNGNPIRDSGDVGEIILRDSSGHVTGCEHEYIFSNADSPRPFTFIVQAPSQVRLLLGTAAATSSLSVLKAGQRVKLQLSGLSPTAPVPPSPPLTPEQVVLTTLLASDVLTSNSQLPQYSGLSYKLEQRINLHQTSAGVLESDEILLVQSDPTPAPTASTIHSIIPGGILWLHSNGFAFSLAVEGRKCRRIICDGVESIQETAVGTTPTDGAGGTVVLRNGEFVYGSCDLAFATRAGAITLCRTYRSHLLADGPLGPGWSFEHAGYLDVSISYYHTIRWCDGSGRFADFDNNDKPPFGLFVGLSRNTAIDNDHSAFQIMDAHRNVLHFNIDGSVRFIKDRSGNKTRYSYNENAQLTKVTDPHGRDLILEYFPVNASQPSKKDGKLMRLTDFAKRSVEFEYYDDGEPAAGWLKTVKLPKADTLLTNGKPGDPPTSGYQRSESYNYNVDQTNRLHGQLLTVTDSEGRIWVTNHYDNSDRVFQQDFGAGTFEFDYDPTSAQPAPFKTKVKDRRKNETVYTFPASPHCDGAAPDSYVEHTGAEDAVHSFEHNFDGNMTRHRLGSRATGGSTVSPLEETFFIYDEKAAEARQHGNLLAVRRKALSGEERVSSYDYTSSPYAPHDYNFVRRAVGPRGNAVGVNSEIYATYYLYDHEVTPQMASANPDLAPGDQGNLVRITLPRSLHMVIGQGASGNHEQFWIDDNPTHILKYNSHGLLNWHKDPHGVVSEHSYYPDDTPTGSLASGAAAAASPAGGGFLAKTERDKDIGTNSARLTYLQGADFELRTTAWKYDALGHTSEIRDNAGNIATVETNDLHEVTKVVLPAAGPGSAQPDKIESTFAYNSLGMCAQTVLQQPGASPDVGGEHPFDEIKSDQLGNISDVFSTLKAGAHVTSHVDRDPNDHPIAVYPEDAVDQPAPPRPDGSIPPDIPALCASSGHGVDLDQRGLPKFLKQGIAQSTGPSLALLTSEYGWHSNGSLKQFKASGAQQSYDYHLDTYGDKFASVDPLGNVVRTLFEDGGLGSRIAMHQGESGPNQTARVAEPAVSDAPILNFSETRVDELGRARRNHTGLFEPAAIGAAGGTATPPRLPEYFPQAAFPPEVGKLLKDGKWGPSDGRATSDTMLDAWNLATRLVDDELGFAYIRRDAHGRPDEISLWGGDDPSKPDVISFVKYSYDAASNPEEVTIREIPIDPTQPQQAYPQKRIYDALGRVVATIDGDGNRHRVEYDEMGHIYARYDSMGADSTEPAYNGHAINKDGNKTTYSRDGLGRINKVEMVLTVGGVGGAAQDTSNPFNPQGTVGIELSYSGGGRLLSYKDHANNETTWTYDQFGRVKSLNFADAATLGGKTAFVFEYDTDTGLIEKTTDANQTVIENSYDDLHRLTRIEVKTAGVKGAAGYLFEYKGSRTITTDLSPAGAAGGGRTVESIRDSLGRLQQEMQGGVVVESEHDGTGNRTELKYPDNHGDVEFNYDSSGRLRKVSDQGREIAHFEYSGLRRLTSRVNQGVTSSFSYSDGYGRLMGMRIDGLANSGTIEYKLERDRMNRITRRTRIAGNNSEERAWTYDSAGRIVKEVFTLTPPSSRAPGPLHVERLYDGDTVLRRETRDIVSGGSVVPTVYNQEREERGRISSRTGAVLKYDRNGNLVDDGTQQYAYDAWNRLIEVRSGGQTIAGFAYDSMHRVISRTSVSGKEEYIYDGWHLIEVRITPSSGPSLLERYVYCDQLDDVVSFEIDGKHFKLLYDPEGYVEALVDDQRNMLERYDYDLNGRVTVLDPAGAPLVDAQGNPARPRSRFLFQRRPYDPDTGLYDYRMRRYNPRLGFFLTPDPTGFADGPNQYVLNHGDPLNFVDRYGMDDKPHAWGSSEERANRGTSQEERNILQRVYDAFTDWDGIKKDFTGDRTKEAFKEGVVKPTLEAVEIELGGRFFGSAEAGLRGLKWWEVFIGRSAIGAAEGASFFSVTSTQNHLLFGDKPTGAQAAASILFPAVLRPTAGVVLDAMGPVRQPFGTELSRSRGEGQSVPMYFESIEAYQKAHRAGVALDAAGKPWGASADGTGPFFRANQLIKFVRGIDPESAKRNLALVEGNLEGTMISKPGLSGKIGTPPALPPGFTDYPKEPLLPWRFSKGVLGRYHGEFRPLNEIFESTTAETKGTIFVFSERIPCPRSCWPAIEFFQKNRSIDTNVILSIERLQKKAMDLFRGLF